MVTNISPNLCPADGKYRRTPLCEKCDYCDINTTSVCLVENQIIKDHGLTWKINVSEKYQQTYFGQTKKSNTFNEYFTDKYMK